MSKSGQWSVVTPHKIVQCWWQHCQQEQVHTAPVTNMSQTLGPQALRYFHDDMPPPPRLDEAKYRIFMTQKPLSMMVLLKILSGGC